MIQPISNNVNFSGRVFAGGADYGDVKALAQNIKGFPTERLRQEVGNDFEKLRRHIAKITPDDANLALIFKKSDKINNNSSKIKLLLQDLDNGDYTAIATKEISPNARTSGIRCFFTKARRKTDTLFQNSNKIQDTQQENIKHIDITA